MTTDVSTKKARDGEPREQYERIVGFSRRAVRFWPTLLAVVAIGSIGCALFLQFRQPSYRSETLILYTEGIRPVEAAGAPTTVGPRDSAVRLREMLLARPRLLATIEKFGLYPDVVAEYGASDAVEKLREHIDFRAPGGDTFSIGFKGDSPEQAHAVTKYLSDSLIEDEASLRLSQAKQHREFLRQERTRTEETLKKAERDVAQFLADNPELALDAMLLMPGASGTGAAIRARSHEAEAVAQAPTPSQWRTIRAPGVPAAATPGAPQGAPAVSADQRREIAAAKARAEADLTAAQSALAEKSARFTELHPDVRALKTRVARERSRVQAATAALAVLREPSAAPSAPAPASPGVRHVRVARPAASVDPAQAKADDARGKNEVVELETEWAALTRSAAEARSKNEQVQASLFRAELSTKSEHDGSSSTMVLLDPAFVPARPMPPGRLTIAGIFLALSLVLGGLVVAGRAAIDDRIYGSKDIERLGRVLAEVAPLPKPRKSR
jgi:polysaccharide biosynthesis transport protein